MAADGVINIDFNVPIEQLQSDSEKIKQLFHSVGEGAGDKLDEDFNKNSEKVKSEAKATSEKVKSEFKTPVNQKIDGDSSKLQEEAEKAKKSTKSIPKEVRTALIADAKNAGIDNFEKLLKKLPKKQQTELLAKAEKGEAIDYEQLLRKIPAKLVTEVKFNDHATTGLKRLQEEADSTEHRFSRLKDVIAGSFIGGLATQGIQSIVSGLKSATEAGMEYNKEQDTMKTVWTALTTEAPKDGQELLKYINDLSQHSIYSADAINKMSQSFYHVHSNVDETKRWTDSFVALGSTLHMTNDQISESGEMFAKIVAGGKASSEDMAVMINRFPMFGEALQEATGKSMKELYAMSAAGKLTAEQFTETIDFLGKKYKDGTAEAMTSFQGMSMYISSRWSKLWGDVTATSFNMSKKATGDIQSLLSDDMMQKYAQGISNALASMTGWLTKLLGYIDAHKNTIVDIIGNGKTILGIIGNTIWNTFLDVVGNVAEMFGLTSKNSKDLKDPLEKIDNILKGLIDHKKDIQNLTKALMLFFAVKKGTEFLGVMTNLLGVFTKFKGINLPTLTLGGGGTIPETALAGIGTKLIKGTPYLAAGAGVADAVLTEKTAGGRIGGSTGAIAGAAGGAAIGSMILPGVGTAIGAGIGALGGTKIGKQLGKDIQKGVKENLPEFKTLGQNFARNFNDSFDGAFKPKISSNMRKFSKDYTDFTAKLNKDSKLKIGLDPKDLTKTKADTDKLYSNMYKNINDFYKKKQKSSKSDLDLMVKNGALTQKQADKIWQNEQKNDKKKKTDQKKLLSDMQKNTDNYYKNVQKVQQGGTKKLEEIAKKYGTNSKQYEKERQKELKKLRSSYQNDLIKDESKLNSKVTAATKIASGKQLDILKDLQAKKSKITHAEMTDTILKSKKQRDTIVDNAEKTKNSTVKKANDKYAETVKAADKERYENGTMSKAQYDEVIKHARKQRDDSINAAEKAKTETVKKADETHRKVVDAATKQAGEHKGAVDGETGQVITSWQEGVAGLAGIWNGMIGGINHVLNALHKGWGGIPEWHGKGYATGTSGLTSDEIALVGEEGFELAHHPNKGIFAVGSNGPEIRHLDAGTSILPHAMSKQFMSMASMLPAHKNGVLGTLTNAYDWVKDKLSDAVDFVSDGAEKVFSSVADHSGIGKFINSIASGAQHDIAQGTFDYSKDKFVEYMKGFFGKYEEESSSAPAGKGSQRWKGQVEKALKVVGLPASGAMINAWLRQIQSESGGNEKAVQGGYTDVNTLSGDLAKGLLQTISATFNAYKMPGHSNIFNGYDNMLASMRYAKSRYGSDMLSVIGHGRGYDSGGHVFNKELAWVAEMGDEWIINNRKGNADQLLEGAIADRADKQPNSIAGKAMQLVQTAKLSNGTMIEPSFNRIQGNNSSQYLGNNTSKDSGDLIVNVDMDSSVIATKTYPIHKAMQAGQITIVANGGAIY